MAGWRLGDQQPAPEKLRIRRGCGDGEVKSPSGMDLGEASWPYQQDGAGTKPASRIGGGTRGF